GTLTYRHHNSKPAALIPVDGASGRREGWASFPAGPFEEAIISRLAEVKASDIRGDGGAGRKVEAAAGRLAGVGGVIRQGRAKMDNPATVDIVAAKLAELNTRRKDLAAELADLQRDAASGLAESWGEFRGLADMMDKDKSDELRIRVRAALRRTIESVTCLFMGDTQHRFGAVRVQFAGSGAHRDYVIAQHVGRLPRGAAREKPAVMSFAEAGLSDSLDLRKPKDAAALEREIERWAKARVK